MRRLPWASVPPARASVWAHLLRRVVRARPPPILSAPCSARHSPTLSSVLTPSPALDALRAASSNTTSCRQPSNSRAPRAPRAGSRCRPSGPPCSPNSTPTSTACARRSHSRRYVPSRSTTTGCGSTRGKRAKKITINIGRASILSRRRRCTSKSSTSLAKAEAPTRRYECALSLLRSPLFQARAPPGRTLAAQPF